METVIHTIFRTDTGEVMVRRSNTECGNGTYFHVSCITEERPIPDGVQNGDEWFCPMDCAATETSNYCRCTKFLAGVPKIECSSGLQCAGQIFFHHHCVDVLEEDVDENGIRMLFE